METKQGEVFSCDIHGWYTNLEVCSRCNKLKRCKTISEPDKIWMKSNLPFFTKKNK
jgi:hypothetical protein